MWKWLTGLVLVVLAVWRPGVVSFGGAAVGTWAVLALLQLGLLVGALVFGVRVPLVVIGVGGEVRTWTSPRRRVVWRTVPLLFAVGLSSVKAPVRRRLFLTALTSLVSSAAAVAGAWSAARAGGGFWHGFAIAGTAVLVNALWPRRGAGTTSPGWFLFSLPRLTGRTAEEFEATPLVNEVSDLLAVGDLDRAEVAAEEMARRYPTLLLSTSAKVAVLTLRTRYAEALHAVSALVGRTDLEPRDMAFVMAEMASATANAVEGGQVPADIGLPAARRAVEGAMQLGYPRYRCTGTLAQLALLEDDHAAAIALATQAGNTSESGLGRADALATIARAQMASGDNAAARRTLVEAVELAGWMPRVAETSARLNVG
ncbi:hypothetical protein [Saccharothrix yanglingensis]|uniref:Tetratricopeptide repeat protein n=1 Tax=Saccharothrix yanglingensis TaxID=659496 RepID=A0ABU0X317_9PSEU|nr:hypothetical protein [Saccharothrix yanglingensis]MDQ2586128.1 hypothetical protein [Saccharothrix yanglingensis]